MTSSATWTNATLASLGVTPGTYVWTWRTGSYTLNSGSLTVSGTGTIAESAGVITIGIEYDWPQHDEKVIITRLLLHVYRPPVVMSQTQEPSQLIEVTGAFQKGLVHQPPRKMKVSPIKGVVKRKNTSPSGPHTQKPVAPRH